MRYSVTASRALINKLILIWMDAADQAAVGNASDEIDRLLKFDPIAQSQDHGHYRTLTVGPLSTVFTVSPDDCMVQILDYIYQE